MLIVIHQKDLVCPIGERNAKQSPNKVNPENVIPHMVHAIGNCVNQCPHSAYATYVAKKPSWALKQVVCKVLVLYKANCPSGANFQG